VLGLEDRPHKINADRGNVVHKALELLARRKLAEQNGHKTFREEEIGKEWRTDRMTSELALEEGWNHYSKKAPYWDWNNQELATCRYHLSVVLNHNGGMYSPLKRTIVCPEQYFDLPIEADWAKRRLYHPHLGKAVDVQLAIKGTVDLVVESTFSPKVLQYIDWKTGSRNDWTSKKKPVPKKDFAKLCQDPQLRMYHWALWKLYPGIEDILITIFYVADGGPFVIPLRKDDLADTEEMFRKKFDQIHSVTVPEDIVGSDKCKWCFHGKTPLSGGKVSACEQVGSEILELGIDRVIAKHGNPDSISAYADGGGRTAPRKKERKVAK